MARELAVATATVGLLHQPALECPVACANPSHRASSCSCRNPVAALVLRRHAVPMAALSVLARRMVRNARPRLQCRGLRLHPLPRHPVVRATDPLQVPADNGVLDVPTGMTAPSWKPCAAARLRSSARRFTSLARTTTPLLHKPAATPVNRRPWCCRPAWPVQPSRNLSNAPQRNPSLQCANAAKKRHVSASVAAPWSCVQRGRPSRYGPK